MNRYTATDTQTDRQLDRHTNRWTPECTHGQTDGQTDRRTDVWIQNERGRQSAQLRNKIDDTAIVVRLMQK